MLVVRFDISRVVELDRVEGEISKMVEWEEVERVMGQVAGAVFLAM